MISMMQRTFMKLRMLVLSIGIKQTYVLSDINFNVNRGEKIAIVGPSGSGKSTLLQIMAGLYQLESGSVRFEKYGYV